MSLNSIIASGVSGLSTSQEALRITSNNISNVNTPGYVRKVTNLESVVLGGEGAGVKVGSIERVTDEFLLRELRNMTAEANRFGAMASIYDRIQSQLGDPASNSTLSGKIDNVFNAFAALTADSSSSVLRREVLTQIENLGSDLRRLAAQTQTYRSELDSEISADVTSLNEALRQIFDINAQIIDFRNNGQETYALEDQRDAALNRLSEVVDIRVIPRSNGGVSITTGNGLALLDDFQYELQYDPANGVSSTTDFSQITVHRLDPVSGVADANGRVLDTKLQSGSLRGRLDMRNVELPAFAAQIGAFASSTAEALNAVHNANMAVPPPSVMSGRNTTLTTTEPHGFTGEATFYSFDADNEIVASVTVDFDSGAISTMADVIAAVDGALGAGTLALSGGVLTMTATGGAAGIGIQQDAADPALRAGKGFSHFFGLNDLVETGIPSSFATGFAATDSHNMTGVVNLDLVGPNGNSLRTVSVDFGAIGGTLGDAVTAINTGLSPYGSVSLDASGALVVTPAVGYEGYSLITDTDTSDRNGTSIGFSALFGVGQPYPADAALSFAVRDYVAANPQSRLALGKVDPTGSPALTLADSRGAVAFQNLALTKLDLPAVGGLNAATGTLQDFAGAILADAGTDAARADSLRSDRTALRDEIDFRYQAIASVNMDEELSDLIIYQNAYNAAARLITTASEMYDTLLNL